MEAWPSCCTVIPASPQISISPVALEPANLRAAFTAAALGYRPRVPVSIDAFADAAQRRALVAERG
ncbi:MAG: hypothetical protein MZV65_35630 [Chromatiales bacterium]|nr:hypothetical protein [Chromatiales bacterium]